MIIDAIGLHDIVLLQTPLEQQTQALMREISKMQEALNEIPKMQETLNRLLKQGESSQESTNQTADAWGFAQQSWIFVIIWTDTVAITHMHLQTYNNMHWAYWYRYIIIIISCKCTSDAFDFSCKNYYYMLIDIPSLYTCVNYYIYNVITL